MQCNAISFQLLYYSLVWFLGDIMCKLYLLWNLIIISNNILKNGHLSYNLAVKLVIY